MDTKDREVSLCTGAAVSKKYINLVLPREGQGEEEVICTSL